MNYESKVFIIKLYWQVL